MNPFIVIVRIMLVPLCIGAVLGVAASAAVQLYTQSKRDTAMVNTTTDYIRALRAGEQYSTYLTVLAYNAEAHTLLALVHSLAIKQDVPTLLHLTEGFTVLRRDPIITNGVIAGSKPIVAASTSDLVEGSRGYGLIHLDQSGELSISFLLIGNPFPRP